jgi:predicted PurR-regulated permease PerM
MRYLEGAGVLLLLSVFFAYILAPAVSAVRRRVRVGKRRRPISDAAALLLIYAVLFLPALLIWPSVADAVRHWVTVTAPTTVDRLFAGGSFEPLDRVLAAAPMTMGVQQGLRIATAGAAGSLERETRRTLDEAIAAAPHAGWLALAPAIAFVLLTGAPIFQRSALRVLPRGHLQWRGDEYLRDVNSALAGYVRAQAGAALIVGVVSVCGFLILGLPSAVSLGVTWGVLELVPAIGPLTALLVASAQAGPHLVPVLIFFFAIRFTQDYLVYPRLIRRGMHLSMWVVILTIWAGAALAQAPGVILAIPVAGFISVSLRHWREYREIETLVATASLPEKAPSERSTTSTT